MSSPQEHFLAKRGRLRVEMQAELERLFKDSVEGELPPATFRDRLDSILDRYLGRDAITPELEASRRQVFAEYETLWRSVDRRDRLVALARQLGINLDQ